MKALLILLCLLVSGVLVFEVERWRQSSTNSGSILDSATRPPVLPKADLYHYGDSDAGTVGFEGKIYNPNSFALTNVRVKWVVYNPINDPRVKEVFDRVGLVEDSCEVEFAYLPPLTTYEFKTEKIIARTRDVIRGVGFGDPALTQTTNLKPKITFSR